MMQKSDKQGPVAILYGHGRHLSLNALFGLGKKSTFLSIPHR